MTNIDFPKIDYSYWLAEWSKSIGKLPTYTNKNLRQYIELSSNINSCTNEIASLVKSKDLAKTTILRVVDLIYSWGGKSGRMFYVSASQQISPRERLAKDESVFNKYLTGVKLARQGNSNSINKFCEIDGIGPSYASKHAYFWSLDSEKPLIIIDSKIAGALGHSTIQSLNKSHNYKDIIKQFREKSFKEFSVEEPSKVERALFAFHNHYFLNDNSGWKNRSENIDFTEAVNLADKLFPV